MADPTPPTATPRRLFRFVWALAAIVAISSVTRSVIAWKHGIPQLFPDEYIYTAIGRSLAHGHLSIRGGAVWFPGILEPVIAAPIWRLASPPLAYHLIQVENAVVASLAAIPIYALARNLRLSRPMALASAVYGLVVPELVLIAYISSDALGYTLALTAIALGVSSLEHPTRKSQAWFAVAATLAALTRVEYIVIAPAYLAAATIIYRKAVVRHGLALLSLLTAVGVTLAGSFGYYLNSGDRGSGLGRGYVSWLFAQSYLCALALGVAIVPGALVGLTRTRRPAERAFALYASVFGALILLESTKFAAATLRFRERYVFVLFALVPIAFGLYIKNGRPRKQLAVALAIVIAVAAARVPISGYAEGTLKIDSQSLFAISSLYGHWSVASISLVVALLATVGAVVAAVLAFRGPPAIALATTLLVAVAATVGATHVDLSQTSAGRKRLLPPDLRWVDHAARGNVTAIETFEAQRSNLIYALYFNTSITREVLLGRAVPTDAFRAPKVSIRPDGSLADISGDVLFDDFGTAGRFANAVTVARAAHFTLWRTNTLARMRYLLEGRYWDGWLHPASRLRAWPTRAGHGVTLSFRLSLPKQWPAVSRVRLGRAQFIIEPGSTIDVKCDSGAGELDIPVDAGRTAIDSGVRSLSVRLTQIAARDHASHPARRPLCR